MEHALFLKERINFSLEFTISTAYHAHRLLVISAVGDNRFNERPKPHSLVACINERIITETPRVYDTTTTALKTTSREDSHPRCLSDLVGPKDKSCGLGMGLSCDILFHRLPGSYPPPATKKGLTYSETSGCGSRREETTTWNGGRASTCTWPNLQGSGACMNVLDEDQDKSSSLLSFARGQL
ncbi:hypothetical protein NM208_g9027 [Fusarium decemcellulare]|uniref:Uncharacterized protein n=1 Tax=Fusarium decemcellulare TaxID=57161 RepID=A0ACC1S348_9HYPO|nr:hypothetical protein NM208_g9027 [Fusarium decemcellulare]